MAKNTLYAIDFRATGGHETHTEVLKEADLLSKDYYKSALRFVSHDAKVKSGADFYREMLDRAAILLVDKLNISEIEKILHMMIEAIPESSKELPLNKLACIDWTDNGEWHFVIGCYDTPMELIQRAFDEVDDVDILTIREIDEAEAEAIKRE
ncbi:MAG: hypothetical protein IJT82_01390 [Schwartzia sp.]|nr:hypothetical protein [Schwartzia sp. (in: firmicutes)]